jgi:hypothetical protein
MCPLSYYLLKICLTKLKQIDSFLTNEDDSEKEKANNQVRAFHTTSIHPFQSDETGSLTFHPVNIHLEEFFLQEIH